MLSSKGNKNSTTKVSIEDKSTIITASPKEESTFKEEKQLSFKEKAKILATEYGLAFTVYWTFCWAVTGIATYAAIEIGDIDSVAMIAKIDSYTGYEISSHVDPKYGNIGLAIAVNEVFEPLRFPLVIVTTKPVVDWVRSFSSKSK